MSVSAIVCSRDRACQLDLLLRSLDENAPGLCDQLTVVWTASDDEYERGYRVCKDQHSGIFFRREAREKHGFQRAIRELLKVSGALVTFFMDDDVLYRELDVEPTPEELLEDERVVCVSLRLGQNTGTCYPLERLQGLPAFETRGADALVWQWRAGDGDFGYPMSLDGHVFRTDLLVAVQHAAEYTNPNQLEDVLAHRAPGMVFEPLMACYRHSHLVSVPANRVNLTHRNRYGDSHFMDERDLNSRYLLGERLDLRQLMRTQSDRVTGAHTELKLVFA